MKKFLSLLLAMLVICSLVTHAFANDVELPVDDDFDDDAWINPFLDVIEGQYYYDAVQWASISKITAGTSESTFSPMKVCTRAQVVTFLWRAAGAPSPKNWNNPFYDVNTSSYYYSAVLWAVENGITVGTGQNSFSPNRGCTRAEVVTFLWRFAGSPTPKNDETSFTDIREGYYRIAVLWANENGITVGTTATTFAPYRICSRGEIVTFLYRMMS